MCVYLYMDNILKEWGGVDVSGAVKPEEKRQSKWKMWLKRQYEVEVLYVPLLCSSSLPFFTLFLLPSTLLCWAIGCALWSTALGSHRCPRHAPIIAAPLAFENQLRGHTLFVIKNERPRVGMFPRREVKGSVWTSGHLQCLTCRHVPWKGGRLPALLMAVCTHAAKRRSDHEIACQVICCEIHYE